DTRVDGDRDQNVSAIDPSAPGLVLARASQVEHRMTEQKRIEHVVQERNDVHINGIAVQALAEERKRPVELGVDTEHAECRIDQHPLNCIAPEEDGVEHHIDDDRDATVHIKECDIDIVHAIGHEEARAAEHQHVHHEEGIDHLPWHDLPGTVSLTVDRNLALQLHLLVPPHTCCGRFYCNRLPWREDARLRSGIL